MPMATNADRHRYQPRHTEDVKDNPDIGKVLQLEMQDAASFHCNDSLPNFWDEKQNCLPCLTALTLASTLTNTNGHARLDSLGSMPASADTVEKMPWKSTQGEGVRLLSFDGGGPQGISQLMMLAEMMQRLKLDEKEAQEPRPCDEFDLIAGSGTGGFIAIILCVLGMTTEQALEVFTELCVNILERPEVDAEARIAEVKIHIDRLLEKYRVDRDMRLMDLKNRCKLFIPISHMNYAEPKCIIRNHDVHQGEALTLNIAEAMLATLAIPPLFASTFASKDMSRSKPTTSDLAFGNPTQDLIAEARKVFGEEARVACALSIGYGHTGIPKVPRGSDGVEFLEQLATHCRQRAKSLESQMKNLSVYHRQWITQGLQCEKDRCSLKARDTTADLPNVAVLRKVDMYAKSVGLPEDVASPKQPKRSEGATDLQSAVPPLGTTSVDLKRGWDFIKKERLGAKDSDGPTLFVISAMGGCGKSQIITKLIHGLEDQLAKIFIIDGSCGPLLDAETAVTADGPLKWNIETFNRLIFSPESRNPDSGSREWTIPPGGLSGQVVIPDYKMPKFGRASLVYRGLWHDKPVAVKVLKARNCAGKTTNWERKLRREIASATSIWAALKHPNILPLFGHSDDFGDFGALISPWCEQGTAQQYLAGQNPNHQKRARLALDVCEGVRYLHGASIIHGDIKPMNILIDDDGIARLSDFGLCRLVRQQELGDLTRTTVYDGPERYMAPEIFASVDVQPATPTYEGDIYALGCIILEFVEGVYPFQRLSSNREVIDAILGRLPPAVRSESIHTPPTTTDGLWNLLDTCWGEPSSRPSIAMVVERVAGLVNPEGGEGLTPIVTNGPLCRNTDDRGGHAGNLLYRSPACSHIASADRPWWSWKWIGRKKGRPTAQIGVSET